MNDSAFLCICEHHMADHMLADTRRECTFLECECERFVWLEPSTVKRASLWDGLIDTHQTESELNGFRATQGALL